jgi:hypothetical protein
MPNSDDDFDDFEDDRDRPRPRRKKSNTGLIITLVVLAVLLFCGLPICLGLLLPGVQKVREAANRMKSSNNLKQIGLAARNYHDTNGEFPSNTYGPDGTPLLSWRVHILPYIEADPLYSQFKLDEPWNGPNNIKLLDRMPKIYAAPGEQNQAGLSKTHYRGFSSPGAVFDRHRVVRPGQTDPHKDVRPADRLTLTAIKDGPGDTIMVVEAADAAEWTKPDDLDVSPGKPVPALGGLWGDKAKFQALMANGTVKVLRADLAENTLRALVTYSGGEVLPVGWDQP